MTAGYFAYFIQTTHMIWRSQSLCYRCRPGQLARVNEQAIHCKI